MKTPEQVLKEAMEASRKLEDNNEYIKKSKQIIHTLESKPIDSWDDKALSGALSKLSIYLGGVGDLASAARLVSNASYAYRKMEKSGHYKKLRSTLDMKIGDAKEEAEAKVAQEIEDELKAQHRADELSTYYESIKIMIMTFQTRIKVILTERSQGGMQA